jgi:Domain of unknown function (DUF4105)
MRFKVRKSWALFQRGGLKLIPLFFVLVLLLLHVRPSYGEDCHNIIMARIIKSAIEKRLYKSYVWKALLQTTGDRPEIRDPKFILSLNNFSLKNELLKTIQSFFERPDTICRFPARYYWIKSELGLNDGFFPSASCPAFQKYLKRAPAQSISLVFVSEDVSSASSMMGHVFLKLSGDDYKHVHVAHAVSFYTVINTYNIPLLIIESTLTGMTGYFSLLPYKEQLRQYLEENRNVWEYRLRLSARARKLIYYHIWELKDVRMKYFFTGYNCATVIYDILSLSSRSFSRSGYLWITPKDVIKDAYQRHLIASAKLIPSDQWKIRMLLATSDKDTTDHIYRLFKKNDFSRPVPSAYGDIAKGLWERELILSYSDYLYKRGKISAEDLDAIENKVNERPEWTAALAGKYHIDLSGYKSPLKTSGESQLGLGYKMLNRRNYLKLYFLPASNTLSDDNREYFSENVLKLFETSLLINRQSVKLESFQLYAMKSLVPWNKFVKGISDQVRLGLEQHYDRELNSHLAVNASAGVGLTGRLSPDMEVYALVNAGLGYGRSRLYPYLYPEAGAIIYDIWNMKTVLSYKYVYNQLGSNHYYHDLGVTQSFFGCRGFKFEFNLEHRFNDRRSDDTYEVMVNKYL